MSAKRLPRTAKPDPDAREDRTTLEATIRFPLHRDFVWVCAVRLTDGTRVDSFMHEWTGRMLRLGVDGAVFGFTPTGRYKVLDLDDVLWQVTPRRWEWLEYGGYESDNLGGETWSEDPDDLESAWAQNPSIPAWSSLDDIPW